MGKISNMQHNQDELNFSYVKKTNPRLNTKGIKNFYNKLRLAYKPGIENEYSLTRSQKKFARTVRGATAIGIVALATSIGIGATVSNHISNKEAVKTETTHETDNIILDRQTVFDDAKSTLANIILPNGSMYTHTPGLVDFPGRNEFRQIISVQVSEQVGLEYSSRYLYNISNNENKKNNPKIYNEFMEKLIEVANTSSPSQKALQDLQNLTQQISQMNLELDGNRIVDLNAKEIDNER